MWEAWLFFKISASKRSPYTYKNSSCRQTPDQSVIHNIRLVINSWESVARNSPALEMLPAASEQVVLLSFCSFSWILSPRTQREEAKLPDWCSHAVNQARSTKITKSQHPLCISDRDGSLSPFPHLHQNSHSLLMNRMGNRSSWKSKDPHPLSNTKKALPARLLLSLCCVQTGQSAEFCLEQPSLGM